MDIYFLGILKTEKTFSKKIVLREPFFGDFFWRLFLETFFGDFFSRNMNLKTFQNIKIMKTNEQIILEFLKECEIVDTEEKELEHIYIKRDKLIDIELYDKMGKAIKKLKGKFSTSSITSLQETAKTRQKWPLLNLIRQLLKINGFIMKPFRKSAGYNSSGKKKYDRYFYVERKEQEKDNNKNELNN
jgi:hypothetical protein